MLSSWNKEKMHEFHSFFKPRSVAVIGASPKLGTVGRALMDNLLESFKGKIYPINLKYDKILGLRCYHSCSELPERPELVVVAIPSKAVPQVIKECGEKGSKAAVVISAGFRETGAEGAKLEEELMKMARTYEMRVIGPNCLGIYDPWSGLDTIFNPSDRQAKPKAGHVAFISQSGALGAAVLDWFAEAGIGMSKFISYGNAADVKEWELIEFLAVDPLTRVIAVYVEGVEDGRKFMKSIRFAVKKGKPVVVLKAGKTERGIKAVASHTGSLAGSYAIYGSAIKQSGGLVVKELNELVTAVKALSWLPEIKGKRVAIITNGGGAGVLATDSIEMNNLVMSELSENTRKTLKGMLPPAASVVNPVDLLGDAPAERYKVALLQVLKDNKVDAVILIGIMQSPAFDPEKILEVVREIVKKYKKPITLVAPGGKYTEDKLRLFEKVAHIPSFRTPEEAVSALNFLAKWMEAKEKSLES